MLITMLQNHPTLLDDSDFTSLCTWDIATVLQCAVTPDNTQLRFWWFQLSARNPGQVEDVK